MSTHLLCCFFVTDSEHALAVLFGCAQIVSTYLLCRDPVSGDPDLQAGLNDLYTVACRLLLDIMPGLETSVIFQENVSPSLSPPYSYSQHLVVWRYLEG